MKVFTSNYHISVNPTLVDDLLAIGMEVIMPSQDFAKKRIEFFAPNDEHTGKGVRMIEYREFLQIPEPIVIITPCMHHIEDFERLYVDRGRKDVMVYLTANSDAKNWYPHKMDYVMSHDLHLHRNGDIKYKILYFNKPTVTVKPKTEAELRRSFDENKLKLFINNFDQPGFEPEYQAAQKLKRMWFTETGVELPFYGYGMPDGWPQPPETHKLMVDCKFNIVFKRRETWGQMVNESMMLGTPCVFLEEFIYSTFEEYLITNDTAIVAKTVEEAVKRMKEMTWEQYQSLVNEAYSQSQMYCNDDVRRQKLAWLFDKVARDDKFMVK